jgi:hypothetical protein
MINEYLFHFINISHFYEQCRDTKSKPQQKIFFSTWKNTFSYLISFGRCCGTCPCWSRTATGWTRQPGRRRLSTSTPLKEHKREIFFGLSSAYTQCARKDCIFLDNGIINFFSLQTLICKQTECKKVQN